MFLSNQRNKEQNLRLSLLLFNKNIGKAFGSKRDEKKVIGFDNWLNQAEYFRIVNSSLRCRFKHIIQTSRSVYVWFRQPASCSLWHSNVAKKYLENPSLKIKRRSACQHRQWPPSYLLTPYCRVLLEKLTYSQLVKKFLAFYGNRKFITAFTSARHVSLSWASSIQSIPPHPTSWRSILILSSHLRLGLPNGLVSSTTISFPVALRPSAPTHSLLIHEVSRSHTKTYHSR